MTETSFERANRLAVEAKAAAKARGGMDWSRYQPLPFGEPLEARDAVEAEAWAEIEREARRHHALREELETLADVVREVLAELKADIERQRKAMTPLKEILAARQLTLNFVDMGSGWLVPVEVPLLTAVVG